MDTVNIVRAIIHHDGRVLVLQNSDDDPNDYAKGRWELPGGWVESHDDHEKEALLREVAEETGLDVMIEEKLERIAVDEGRGLKDCQLYLAAADARDVALSDEHQAYRWIDPAAFKDMDWLYYAGFTIPVLERIKDKV